MPCPVSLGFQAPWVLIIDVPGAHQGFTAGSPAPGSRS